LGQVRGFVPASQLTSVAPTASSERKKRTTRFYAALMGDTLMLKVIDIDRKRNRLILSERLAMREWRRQQKEQLLDSLTEGLTHRRHRSAASPTSAPLSISAARTV
jgi:small subunit ribosomal protein S1